jgi:hypothetical protein
VFLQRPRAEEVEITVLVSTQFRDRKLKAIRVSILINGDVSTKSWTSIQDLTKLNEEFASWFVANLELVVPDWASYRLRLTPFEKVEGLVDPQKFTQEMGELFWTMASEFLKGMSDPGWVEAFSSQPPTDSSLAGNS